MTQQAPYGYVTLAQALQQVSNRLYDGTQVFWTPDELTVYLTEALQTWNALTGMWREDFTFQTSSGTIWYDLTDTTAMPNTIRPYTVTDASLYSEILYHLLEPPTGPVSVQLTTDDIQNALQRRRDEILAMTSCTQTRSLVGAVNGRITLADNVIDVRRMVYQPAFIPQGGYGSGFYGSGLYGLSLPNVIEGYVMWPEDIWGIDAYNPLWTLQPAGKPYSYQISTEPPLSFTVDKPPDSAGNYELLTVNAGGTLSLTPITTPSTFPIPDDWTHVIKWGALSDLFNRESNAKDAPRAAYCEQRYKMGLKLLEKAPALLAIRISNVPLQIEAVRAADLFDTTWQSQVPTQPIKCLHSGLNLIALAPTPDNGPAQTGQPYMVTVTCVENAPIPPTPGDFIQASRGDLDAIVDYTVHLAALKMGGAEFTATIPLFQRFLEQASTYGLKLKEIADYTDIIYGLGYVEKAMNPVTAPAGDE